MTLHGLLSNHSPDLWQPKITPVCGESASRRYHFAFRDSIRTLFFTKQLAHGSLWLSDRSIKRCVKGIGSDPGFSSFKVPKV